MKKPDFDQNKNSADNDQHPEGVGRRKFRHMRKIHAIPPYQQGQGGEDGGQHCEELHQAVELDIGLSLVSLPYLGDIIPEVYGILVESVDAAGQKVE